MVILQYYYVVENNNDQKKGKIKLYQLKYDFAADEQESVNLHSEMIL